MKNRNSGIIILAAGSSSRLGQPKQLLPYKGRSLLQIAIDAAHKSRGDHKVLVLGANADKIEKSVEAGSMKVLLNENWNQGMTSTIQIGLDYLTQKYEIEQVIIILCDQPFVDEKLIDKLIQTQSSSEKGIVAAKYGNTLGVPVLFTKKYFSQIMAFKGQDGAKKLLEENKYDLEIVDFPLGQIDIDTQEDFDKLTS